MTDAATAQGTDPGDRELRAFRQAALVVGGLAAVAVGLTQLSGVVVYELVLLVTSDPANSTAGAVSGAFGEFLWFLGTRVVPLLAILLAFYLTAGRDLPGPAVAAGTFVGGLVMPVGFVLGAAFVRPVGGTVLGADALLRFATMLLPVVAAFLAALLGAAMDDLWERGASWRGIRG